MILHIIDVCFWYPPSTKAAMPQKQPWGYDQTTQVPGATPNQSRNVTNQKDQKDVEAAENYR